MIIACIAAAFDGFLWLHLMSLDPGPWVAALQEVSVCSACRPGQQLLHKRTLQDLGCPVTGLPHQIPDACGSDEAPQGGPCSTIIDKLALIAHQLCDKPIVLQ